MSHDDFAGEPVRGLPEELPRGEVILWQGRPHWLTLARESLNLSWVAAYFGLLALWRVGATWDLGTPAEALANALPMLAVGAAACSLLMLVAWMQAAATVYTITNRRVAMRVGAALTMTLNLPFRQIASAGLKPHGGGRGTIAMTLMSGPRRLSYLVLWPHARPWRVSRPEPALRAIPDAARVAQILAEAADARIAEPQVARQPAPMLAAE